MTFKRYSKILPLNNDLNVRFIPHTKLEYLDYKILVIHLYAFTCFSPSSDFSKLWLSTAVCSLVGRLSAAFAAEPSVSSDATLHPSASLWARGNVNFKPERWELGDKIHVGANKRGKRQGWSTHILIACEQVLLLQLLHAFSAAVQSLFPPQSEQQCTVCLKMHLEKQFNDYCVQCL